MFTTAMSTTAAEHWTLQVSSLGKEQLKSLGQAGELCCSHLLPLYLSHHASVLIL